MSGQARDGKPWSGCSGDILSHQYQYEKFIFPSFTTGNDTSRHPRLKVTYEQRYPRSATVSWFFSFLVRSFSFLLLLRARNCGFGASDSHQWADACIWGRLACCRPCCMPKASSWIRFDVLTGVCNSILQGDLVVKSSYHHSSSYVVGSPRSCGVVGVWIMLV